MDLDIMASVQEQIIGNCLCVLGDAMAMPIGSMIEQVPRRVRGAHRGARARARARSRPTSAGRAGSIPTAAPPDAAPRAKTITFTIDGREVQAPENAMLVDARQARRRRDPGLLLRAQARPARSAPAACAWSRSRASRSCRPAARRRSRTAWSSTRRPSACTRRSRRSSSSCSINHPLDCPVCDKGGECPLQDITFGWGGGTLALHRAQAPLRQAARALAADRDRPRALHPLLPLRALLAGDRRGLPARPARARRALLRRHLRRPPLRRAVQRQHHRAVPGRRAHLARLPLPRAPVGHRGRGLGLHAVPGAVQRRASPCATSACCACSRATTTRSTTAGCATRAASPTSRSTSTSASPSRCVRDGGELRPVSLGARARGGRGRALEARGRAGRRRSPAARRTNEEGFLLARLLREGLGSADLDSRARRRAAAGAAPRARRARRCRRRSPTSSSPTPCWCSTASRSTTRRSSTCASARACAATA